MRRIELEDVPYTVVERAQKLNVEDVICKVTSGKTSQVRFTNNEIISTNTYERTSGEVFLARGKKVLTVNIHDFKNLSYTIENIVKMLDSAGENMDYGGIPKTKHRYPKPWYDRKIGRLGKELIDYAQNAINTALKNGAKRVAGVIYANSFKTYYASSNGSKGVDGKSSLTLSVRAFANGDSSGHAVFCTTSLSEFSVENTAGKAAEIAKTARDSKMGEPGKYDVIFDPLAFGNLLGYIGAFASAFLVDTGYSFLKDKLNKPVAKDSVTIYDGGNIKAGINSALFDDEGVPTKKTAVIKNGILKTYLHNTTTAKKHRTQTTGNAGIIIPRPWNIILKKGDWRKEELFESVERGLYITNLWYGRFQNYQEGDFSILPRDGIFLIIRGKIVESVRNIRISDNLQRILFAIEGIGNELEQVYWWEMETPAFSPYVLVRDVNITRSTG